MRVIRTEMYFADFRFESAAGLPGVSVGWISGHTRSELRYGRLPLSDGNVDYSNTFQDIELSAIYEIAFEFKIISTIRYSLYARPSGAAQVDNSYIDFVMDQPIVVEESPPTWIKLKEIVDSFRKDPKAVGAFIGIIAGYQYPPFLLITVPAGILLVGSAPAITAAIERGLVKIIDDFFDKEE